MRLIVSILIAWIFTLFWLLKHEWYFDLWVINLINLDWTFDTNLSFIKNIFDYIFYIPDLIFESSKGNIKEYFKDSIVLLPKEIYLFIIFIYHFINIFIIAQILRILVTYNQRNIAILIITIIYLFIITIMKNLVEFLK